MLDSQLRIPVWLHDRSDICYSIKEYAQAIFDHHLRDMVLVGLRLMADLNDSRFCSGPFQRRTAVVQGNRHCAQCGHHH
jgi:hypothetical protein